MSIFRNFSYYLGSVLSIRFAGMLAVPLYFYFIDKRDYGIFALFLLVRQFTGFALTLNGDWILYERFVKADENTKRSIVTHIFSLSFALILLSLILCLGALFHPRLGTLIVGPDDLAITRGLWPWLLIDGLLMPFGLASNLRVLLGQARRSAVAETVSFLVGSGSTILLLASTHLRWEALIVGNLLNALSVSVWNFHFLKAYLGSPLKRDFFAELLRVGAISASKNFGTLLIRRADQVLVSKFFGIEELGVYAFAVRMFGNVEEVFRAVSKAYLPIQVTDMPKILERDQRVLKSHQILRLSLLYVAASCFWAAYFLGEPGIRLLSNGRIHEAGFVLAILTICPLAQTTLEHYGNFLFIQGRFSVIPVITLISGTSGLILAYGLIPKIGLPGAAISQSTAMVVEALLYNFFGKRSLGFQLFPKVEKEGLSLLVAALAALVVHAVLPFSSSVAVSLGILGLIVIFRRKSIAKAVSTIKARFIAQKTR